MAMMSSAMTASFWTGGLAWLLRMPAITVAICRSVAIEREATLGIVPGKRGEAAMVVTEFAFAPRSAVPEAQAVI